MPRIVELLKYAGNKTIQYEAVWCVINIAMEDADIINCLVSKNVIPHLVELVRSGDEDMKEVAIWALANITVEGIDYIDKTLDAGIMKPLLPILHTSTNLCLLEQAVRMLNNFFKYSDEIDHKEEILVAVCKIINRVNAFEILSDCCSILLNMNECKVPVMYETGVLKRLISLLEYFGL